ncbi:uncharacterized protein LOC135848813 [Planococcus citri]|uniref:uncharacterized protein LOC135848813 n=1 Tax=Planococcus citri TaxID=170843 RepID=UPI0031F857F0
MCEFSSIESTRRDFECCLQPIACLVPGGLSKLYERSLVLIVLIYHPASFIKLHLGDDSRSCSSSELIFKTKRRENSKYTNFESRKDFADFSMSPSLPRLGDRIRSLL